MTPQKIRASVVLERVAWVRKMVDGLRRIPAGSLEELLSDERNVPAAESYLRRALEGLLDLGRHILAKGFGEGVLEYKAIAGELGRNGVLSQDTSVLLTEMAGYRNRLTHFYDEVTPKELYLILSSRLSDIEEVLQEILHWLREHPERLDDSI